MSSLNRCILAGRLTKAPQVRYSKDEMAECYFDISVYKADKKNVITCVAFAGLAKICGEYLKKGRLVAVEGKLSLANKRKEIIVDNMQLLDSKLFEAKAPKEKIK